MGKKLKEKSRKSQKALEEKIVRDKEDKQYKYYLVICLFGVLNMLLVLLLGAIIWMRLMETVPPPPVSRVCVYCKVRKDWVGAST